MSFCCLSHTIASISSIGGNPIQIFTNSSIDTRSIRISATVAKGHDASQTENAITYNQRTATVTLKEENFQKKLKLQIIFLQISPPT